MPKVWCAGIDAAALGATAGTWGSAGTLTVKDGSTHILGLIASVAISAKTAGLSGIAIARMTSKSLGIAQEEFVLGRTTMLDPIATNDKESVNLAEFIPLDYRAKDGAKIDIDVTSAVDLTGGFDVAFGLVMSDFAPGNDSFYMELLSQCCGPVKGGTQTQSDAGISAATYTAYTTGLTIPASATMLKGILSHLVPNAPTAGENAVFITKLLSNAIKDFSPQEWPGSIAYQPSLGTPVGTSLSAPAWYWPTRFDLPGKEITVNIEQILAVALSNAADGIVGVKYS